VRGIDPHPVYKCTVGRTEIAKESLWRSDLEKAMMSREKSVVRQTELGILAPADHERRVLVECKVPACLGSGHDMKSNAHLIDYMGILAYLANTAKNQYTSVARKLTTPNTIPPIAIPRPPYRLRSLSAFRIPRNPRKAAGNPSQTPPKQQIIGMLRIPSIREVVGSVWSVD
jgi:hypothetical protein